METIEVIPIEQFRKGYNGLSKELNKMKNYDQSSEDEKKMIDWFYELLDEHLSTSDILPFE